MKATKIGKTLLATGVAASARKLTFDCTGLRETDEDTSALVTDGKT
jgi:hypothetical protein